MDLGGPIWHALSGGFFKNILGLIKNIVSLIFAVPPLQGIITTSLTKDGLAAFWHERHTLRTALDPLTGAPLPSSDGSPGPRPDVPAFLFRLKDAILDTGKCINVVKSCSRDPPRTLPLGTRLRYSEDSGRYVVRIEEAHRAAASAALDLLRREAGLLGGLEVLRRYFLTQQGDLFLHFMDAAEVQLGRHVGQVPLQQLQALLEMTARGSSAAADPAAAKLKAAYDHRNVLNMLVAIVQLPGEPGAGSGADVAGPSVSFLSCQFSRGFSF
jgi:hypothetical protein